jgi:hypothetical protein
VRRFSVATVSEGEDEMDELDDDHPDQNARSVSGGSWMRSNSGAANVMVDANMSEIDANIGVRNVPEEDSGRGGFPYFFVHFAVHSRCWCDDLEDFRISRRN